MSYLDTAENVYKEAAINPQKGLCCTTTPIWQLPGLDIPSRMLEMNYGCGSTVHPRDLVNDPAVLYVGVGGGMELLQFSYFNRKKGGVIGIDPVDEMLEACRINLKEAEIFNPWFKSEFVVLEKGNALSLPLDDGSVEVAAQNCLFNIFTKSDMETALREMYRVLKPNGRLILSDPVCERIIPDNLRNDEKLRALCLSGAIPLKEYINMITGVGFGTIEVRAKRPYRILDPGHYEIDQTILVESVELCAIKDPMPDDGPCVFTGKTVVYYGKEDSFDDGKGHLIMQNQPLAICDKTAAALAELDRDDMHISESTFFYDGGGCC